MQMVVVGAAVVLNAQGTSATASALTACLPAHSRCRPGGSSAGAGPPSRLPQPLPTPAPVLELHRDKVLARPPARAPSKPPRGMMGHCMCQLDWPRGGWDTDICSTMILGVSGKGTQGEMNIDRVKQKVGFMQSAEGMKSPKG